MQEAKGMFGVYYGTLQSYSMFLSGLAMYKRLTQGFAIMKIFIIGIPMLHQLLDGFRILRTKIKSLKIPYILDLKVVKKSNVYDLEIDVEIIYMPNKKCLGLYSPPPQPKKKGEKRQSSLMYKL